MNDANDDSFENDDNDDRNDDNDNAGVFLAQLVVLAKLIMMMTIAMMTMVIVMMNMMTFMMISTTLYSRCVPGTARCSGEAECTDASDEFEYVKDERIMMMMKLGADLF